MGGHDAFSTIAAGLYQPTPQLVERVRRIADGPPPETNIYASHENINNKRVIVQYVQ